MPHVSVIIPSYNHAPFLRQRIASVLAQTFTDVERFFLDDASSDETLEVFRELDRGDFVLMTNARNSGSTFRQWNKGAAAATGEYLWFAESDDFADPTLLQTLVDQLDRNPSCGIATCITNNVNVDGQVVGNTLTWLCSTNVDTALWRNDFTMPGKALCAGPLLRRCVIPNASGVLIRRSAFVAAGGADESMRLAGDWMTYAKILQYGDFAFVAQALNYCRMHRGSVRARTQRSGLEVEESYRVFNYIRAQVALPARVERERAQELLNQWSESVAQGLIPPRRILPIYRQARQSTLLASLRFALVTLRKLARRGVAMAHWLLLALWE